MNEIPVLMNFIRIASWWLVWLSVAGLHLLFAVALLLGLWWFGISPDAVVLWFRSTSPQTLSVLGLSIAAYGLAVRKLARFAHNLVCVRCLGFL